MKPNLTEPEAIKLAQDAIKDSNFAELLTIATLNKDSGGNLTWVIGSATIGSGLEVTLDDESTRIIDIKEVGIR